MTNKADRLALLTQAVYTSLGHYECLLSIKNGGRTLANRTRPILSERGVVDGLVHIVKMRRSAGLSTLADYGLFSISFEQIVLDFDDIVEFQDPDLRALAKDNLTNARLEADARREVEQ